METKTFKYCVKTTGQLYSNFVFENSESLEKWTKEEFPALQRKYGKMHMGVYDLPKLKVGDTCRVIGEGNEIFTIEGLKEYSPNRYGFILDSGWCEEVAKCY